MTSNWSSSSRRARSSIVGRQVVDGVDAQCTGRFELGMQVGQLLLDDLTEAGEEVVAHAELGHAGPVPRFPRLLDRVGRFLGVALKDRDLVAPPGQHHRCPETADPTTDYHDLRHGDCEASSAATRVDKSHA